MSIVRRQPVLYKNKGGAFAKGKNAVAICQRSGFKYKQRDMVFEPGTNYFVHRSESDKEHNLVTDALNFDSDKVGKPEGNLKYTSPEVPLSIGIVVSATDLVQVDGIIQRSFYAYPGTSVTTTE